MKPEEIRDIDRVHVHKAEHRVGVIERTKSGARFAYDPEYLERAQDEKLGPVAFAMPLTDEDYEISGDNLHPFFAGLLPEGLRLTALVSALKTSADDMFSLLAASGSDTIGDVFVTLDGKVAAEKSSGEVELEQASFKELLEQSLASLGLESSSADIAIPGIQPKISAAMISFPVSVAKRRKRYLMKLAPEKFPRLVENEHFFMELASSCGLDAAKTSVIHDINSVPALLVERFDRVWDKSAKKIARLHQEDACQLLSRYPQDKYRLSMREIAEGISSVASSPIIEQSKLLALTVFSYLIANGDMHAKNVSVIAKDGRVVLTPAYDLVSTLPYGDQTMALELEGRKTKLRVADFVAWGKRGGLREAAVESTIRRVTDKIAPAIDELERIGLDEKKTDFLRRSIRERLDGLGL